MIVGLKNDNSTDVPLFNLEQELFVNSQIVRKICGKFTVKKQNGSDDKEMHTTAKEF